MKVSEAIEMYDALSVLGQKDNLPGKMAYGVAKNLHVLKPIYTTLNEKKNEWLKKHASPGEDGSYTVEGDNRLAFVQYMNPILEQDEVLPDGMRTLCESDIPDGVEPAVLVPLMGIIEEGGCGCSETPKE